MSLERTEGGFSIEASLLGELCGVAVDQVQALMRRREITSLCERGVDEDAGRYRLTFFCGNRRARLLVDEAGRIVRRSIVDYGERPMLSAPRRPEAP